MKEIEKLFTEKLKPAIRPALEARDEIENQLKKNAVDHRNFTKLNASAEDEIKKLEEALDSRIVSGKNADDIVNKIAGKKAELGAFQRHLAKLDDTSAELSTQLQAANRRLSDALGMAIDSLRGDVQALIENALNQVLEICIAFELAGHAEEEALGVELAKQRDLAVYRFPDANIFNALEAYLGPYGEDVSAVKRREVIADHRRRQAEAKGEQT
jgi:hypothetical protein